MQITRLRRVGEHDPLRGVVVLDVLRRTNAVEITAIARFESNVVRKRKDVVGPD